MRRYQFGLRATTWMLIVGLAGLICALCFLGVTPPTSRDALTHHLAIPKLYLSHGGIYEIPFMVFSYYPMNLDLLYMVSLHFGSDIVPKFIHFSFGLLTALLIFFYLKPRVNSVYALFGVFLFLSLPIIIKLSITVYVDLGLVFFSTASLLIIIRWLNNGFHFRLLILSAICCGLAMGTKYNGLIVFLLLTLFVPFLYSKYHPADKTLFLNTMGQGMIFAFVAFLVFSPWMIRNYLWTQNPIYPLYDQWFNPQSNISDSIGVFAFRSFAYKEQWWEIALLPIRVFFQGQDNHPQYFDGRLNPGLFFLPFFAFFNTKADSQAIKREKMILLGFAVLFFLFAFFTRGLRIRYILPSIPPLVLLSVMGFRNLTNFSSRMTIPWAKRSMWIGIFGAVSICLLLNLEYLISQFRIIDPLSYLSGAVNREEYITRHHPEYPVIQYINKNLSSDTLILFIFMGNRGYYCDRDYLFDMKRSKSRIQYLAEKSDRVEDIRRALIDMKVTHILMNDGTFGRWIKNNFSNRARMMVHQFEKEYLELLYAENGYSLYVLKKENQVLNKYNRGSDHFDLVSAW